MFNLLVKVIERFFVLIGSTVKYCLLLSDHLADELNVRLYSIVNIIFLHGFVIHLVDPLVHPVADLLAALLLGGLLLVELICQCGNLRFKLGRVHDVCSYLRLVVRHHAWKLLVYLSDQTLHLVGSLLMLSCYVLL